MLNVNFEIHASRLYYLASGVSVFSFGTPFFDAAVYKMMGKIDTQDVDGED